MEVGAYQQKIKELNERWQLLAQLLALEDKQTELQSVERELENPNIWNDPERAQALGKKRAELSQVIDQLVGLKKQLDEVAELYELAKEEEEAELLASVISDIDVLETVIVELEFHRMFNNPMDPHPAYVDVQAGSGGTEAQDWAEMLLRMYLRWAERRGFESRNDGSVSG